MADNALAVYQRVENPISFCDSMALAFASVVGCDERQGKAMAMQALCEGLNPMQLQRRYHWIQGKPSMRADAMRAEFRMNHGGDFELIESTGDVAHVKFTDSKGRTYDSRITWEQAQKEPWPWKKGCGPGTDKTEPTLANVKDNWATPLSRANMLMARATSTALRYLCPELVAGVYTPEEMADVVATTASEPAAPKETFSQIIAVTTSSEPLPGEVPGAIAAADGNEPPFEEAEFEEKQQDPATPGSVTEGQITQISELGEKAWGESWPANRDAALAKRNCSTLRNLSYQQADDLFKKMQDVAREQAAKN